jgi:transposase-like protein
MLACPDCASKRIVRAGFSRLTLSYAHERRQQYQCQNCRRRFLEHVYTIFFWLKKVDPALNAKILQLCLQGLSNRAIGRVLFVSEHLVRLRLTRMAQRGLVFQAELLRNFRINEPLCFDGLENFAGTQYDPNNVQQAVGRDSLFIYDFNFAGLNRKGHMSPWQKLRNLEIETDFGRYNPEGVRLATAEILNRLYEKRGAAAPFTLISDKHFHYRKVVGQDLRMLRIQHLTISSKACRNFKNKLFPVNHADLLIRQQVRAFFRETISFSKTPGAMCQKYALFMIAKNFLLPQFTKKLVSRPEAHLKSPAEMLGLTSRLLTFSDIFHRRSTKEDLKHLNSDWQHFWRGEIPRVYLRNAEFRRTRAPLT